MREAWTRTSITQTALLVHAGTEVDERHCWALARAFWRAVASPAVPGSDGSGHWLDRCGFYRARMLEELLRDEANATTRRAFTKIKAKALDRIVRRALVEATALVWDLRLKRLRDLAVQMRHQRA